MDWISNKYINNSNNQHRLISQWVSCVCVCETCACTASSSSDPQSNTTHREDRNQHRCQELQGRKWDAFGRDRRLLSEKATSSKQTICRQFTDVASWLCWRLVVEGDVPYLLKERTAGNLTGWVTGDSISSLELSSDEPASHMLTYTYIHKEKNYVPWQTNDFGLTSLLVVKSI